MTSQNRRKNFNPRSRGGSDNHTFDLSRTKNSFQSTLPRRERHQTGSPYRRILLISIHAPAEGATASDEYDFTTMIVFQSTLPRRERLHQSAINGYGLSISIHAPAEGATDPELALAFHQSISIHAPAEGATCFPVGVLCGGDQFQSTLPRRERPSKLACISLSFINFNPRSRGGSDD